MSVTIGAVVFDWAGTVQDHGSRAPVVALVALFGRHGVVITEEQARRPMGRSKLDHIRDILAEPSVAEGWEQAHGHPPSEADALAMYRAFGPLQNHAVTTHADLIAGTVEAVRACRARGYRIGSTTGYPRAAAELAAEAAAAEGYAPDVLVCSDDVPAGRPAPWMLYRNLEQLGVYPAWRCVKVGDTQVDMAEGRNAGAWTVGVSETGNLLGMTAEGLAALPVAERARRADQAAAELRTAGAHAVIGSVADLVPALDAIEDRIRHGERP